MCLNRFALEPEGHPPHLFIEAVGADSRELLLYGRPRDDHCCSRGAICLNRFPFEP